MGGPPPGYTPPAANYRGAGGSYPGSAAGYGSQRAAGTAGSWGAAPPAYGSQPAAAGTASSWGGAAATATAGMGYGYPAYGGAQTSHTQRR